MSSAGCEGGGFALVGLADGSTVAGDQRGTVAASRLGPTFLVKGRYVEFTVVAATFGVRDQLFTGAPNALDLTGGRRTVIFASKTPDRRARPSRARSATLITHVLADGVCYFDNPNSREREGDVVGYKDTTVTVSTRVNFANDVASRFVGRDSPQVATRVQEPACPNQFVSRVHGPETVFHCGGSSRWNVASGGRMGMVTGEDAVGVAPPASDCTSQCQAQNQVRGQAVVLGSPLPVPEESRLKPRLP